MTDAGHKSGFVPRYHAISATAPRAEGPRSQTLSPAARRIGTVPPWRGIPAGGTPVDLVSLPSDSLPKSFGSTGPFLLQTRGLPGPFFPRAVPGRSPSAVIRLQDRASQGDGKPGRTRRPRASCEGSEAGPSKARKAAHPRPAARIPRPSHDLPRFRTRPGRARTSVRSAPHSLASSRLGHRRPGPPRISTGHGARRASAPEAHVPSAPRRAPRVGALVARAPALSGERAPTRDRARRARSAHALRRERDGPFETSGLRACARRARRHAP